MFRTFDRYFDLRPLERWIDWLNATWWFHLILGIVVGWHIRQERNRYERYKREILSF